MRYIISLLFIVIFIPTPAFPQEHVVMQLKWLHHFQFAGYYAALEKGFYKDAGLDVELREGGPDLYVEEEVLSGRADFGVGTSAILPLRAKGDDLVVLAQIFQHSPAVFMTLRSSGIHSIADMAGKRFMYSNQHGDMIALLRLNGVDEKVLVKVPHKGDPIDLIQKKADVMMAYSFNEPFVLEQAGEPYLIFSPKSAGIDFYGDNLFATGVTIKNRPDVVKKFREATLKGWHYALNNKSEMLDLILSKYSQQKSREWLEFEANQIDELIQQNLIALGHQNPERWEKIAATFVAQGMMPKSYDYTSIIYKPKQEVDYTLAGVVSLIASIIIAALASIIIYFRRMNRKMEQNIAERNAAELKRIASEERFRTLFENSPAGIIVTDFSSNIIMANKRIAEMIGTTVESLVGTHYLELLHPGHRTQASDCMRQLLLNTKKYVNAERQYLKTDGGDFWAQVAGCPQENAFGDLENVFWHILDISENKEIEAAQKKMELQLLQAQKLESLGVLAGGIAHDFNNILMAIMGNAELAIMRLKPESPVIDNLNKIEKSAARAADLAKQMLAYSGKGKFLVENINLNSLLEEMLHLLEVSISKKAILRLNLMEQLPSVRVDATQIRQIIMNLVINASEAIGEKSGVIAISTGCMDCDRSYLRDIWFDKHLEIGLYVYLEVSDTGCGMTKETMAKLFDPFFTTKFTGRGLGMSAVLGIVRGHHGAIKVYSEVGKGTTFKILLPASGKPAELFNGHNIVEKWKGSGTVLLVDDEETVRGIGSEMLKELGFDVITATDGKDALVHFAEHPEIIFVLLDLTMPRMDGEQCYRELRLLKPDVKVIVSSGYSEQEVSEKFLGKGLAGFIQKPYRLSVLQDVIKNMK